MSLHSVVCRVCGMREDAHRAKDMRCPARPDFPRMAKLPDNATLERIERAEAALDKRIKQHWNKRTTHFQPVT